MFLKLWTTLIGYSVPSHFYYSVTEVNNMKSKNTKQSAIDSDFNDEADLI